MSVDPRTLDREQLRDAGITSPVGYDRDRQAPGTALRETPPVNFQSWIPFRGRWLKPRALELRGSDQPVMLLPDNPKRFGVWLYNAGGQIELPIPLPGQGFTQQQGAVLPTGASSVFIDSGSVQVPTYAGSSYKTIYVVVDVAIAKSGAVQSTIQLLVGRQPWPPANGALTQVGAGNNLSFVAAKGAAQNLGGAAASIAQGIYAFSPADIGDLQWPHPYIGVEINAGGAQTLSAGVARLLMQMPGGPLVMLGSENSVNAALTGERSNSFPLPASSGWQLWQGDGELWAACTPGLALLHLVEIRYRDDVADGPPA